MTYSTKQILPELRFGSPQVLGNVVVVPVLASDENGPDYVWLREAIEKEYQTVEEVSAGGSVPELRVRNTSDYHVLMLDGEELQGAKQNRFLNTSILVKPHSELVAPVSCSERGRWAAKSRSFSHSDSYMSIHSRSKRAAQVKESLSTDGSFSSDQERVWQDIEELHRKAGTDRTSRTHAMSDAYQSKKADIEASLTHLEWQPHQRGSLVFINGKVAGLELISRAETYSSIHRHLMKSYLLEALFLEPETQAEVSLEKAHEFVGKAMECTEEVFKSVGEGFDHRLESDEIIGSGLVDGEALLHLGLFSRV